MNKRKSDCILELQNIKKSFGNRTILDIPSWMIGEGVYWIVGENGAGKSTLFRVIAGMLPFNGEIYLNEAISLRKNPVQYRLGVSLGEAEPLYPSFLTPDDLILFTAGARNSPPDQAESLIVRFGISSYRKQPLGACSSGMIKKVSLAMAFLGNPSLIILDEPLITIDQEAKSTLMELISERRHRGVSFLISSHQSFEKDSVKIDGLFRLSDTIITPAPAR